MFDGLSDKSTQHKHIGTISNEVTTNDCWIFCLCDNYCCGLHIV